MAALTKTLNQTLLSLQSNAASTVLIGTPVDVSTKFTGSIFAHFGRRAATASTAAANLRIEASSKSSGDGFWWPLVVFVTQFALVETEAVTGTVNSGQKVITCASTTNLTAGTLLYIDNGTIGNSEFHRIKSVVANTSVTVEDNLNNAQTSANLYAGAEFFMAQFDLSSVARVRAVLDGSLFTQACAIEAYMVTADSIA